MSAVIENDCGARAGINCTTNTTRLPSPRTNSNTASNGGSRQPTSPPKPTLWAADGTYSNSADHMNRVDQRAHVGGCGATTADQPTRQRPSRRSNSDTASNGGSRQPTSPPKPISEAADGTYSNSVAQVCRDSREKPGGGIGETGVLLDRKTHSLADSRFSDPLVMQIVENWRIRQDIVRAQQRLTLQIKSICRRFTDGDKEKAEKLYKALEAGATEHPAALATMALFVAREPLETTRASLEKRLTKLGENLPIAHVIEEIRGVNGKTLASVVGECGDLSAYKSVQAVWKRAGLAVIEGERQRKKAGDAALLHGYAPERHAVFWNIGAALLKAQGKDEAAGPFRRIYDERKALERSRVETDGHAHNRALRYMTKALVKRLVLAWREVKRSEA